MHIFQFQSLTNVGYLLMISTTSQSLWITHIICAINPLTSTLVVILHDYRLVTYWTIIIFSITLIIITLAIFIYVLSSTRHHHIPFTQKLTIWLSKNHSFQQSYQAISWVANCPSTQNIVIAYAPITWFYSYNMFLYLAPSL